jgi:hypothetical protein
MEIDNNKSVARAKLILITLPFVLLLCCSVPALFQMIDTWLPTIISGTLMIICWIIVLAMNLMSFRFKFSADVISVFYHPINPMTSSFKRIDIESGKLLKYHIRTSMSGLKKELLLYENIGGQEASYPPVSITLCGGKTIRQIEEYLNSYLSAGTSS